ncbi:pho2 [Candida metapsilosis]|uniref:Pho2 n=1 Tax=Candida metapsilosis TaxID=273372 RepID=A0A8H7ZHJ7_9ASCO|nr:pho2 [Candida metapsilosis]
MDPSVFAAMTRKSNPIDISSKETLQHLIDHYDNFLFDCDGVVWLGDELIPGAAEFIQLLVDNGKQLAFVTNNSSNSRNTYFQKFARLGIPNITKDMIYPTCYSAALEVRDQLKIPLGSKIWILGEHGIEEELQEMGYVTLGCNDPKLNNLDLDSSILEVDPEVRAVVVGSTKDFNYMRISSTLQYLLYNDKSIPFIGCNIDKTYPGPRGLTLPAGGSVVNYMAFTSERNFINVGKPSGQFLNIILQDRQFDRDRTLMIGDTLYTDVKFGNDGQLGDGRGSLLVLSGGTKLKDLQKLIESGGSKEDLIPSYYAESLGQLAEVYGVEK